MSKRDLISDGRALGRALIIAATEYGESADPAVQQKLVTEFLVMCHSAFGYLAVRNPIAAEILDAAEEEFLRFNSEHQQLLKDRMMTYLDAVADSRGRDIAVSVGRIFAQNIKGSADDARWAGGAFEESLALFGELSGFEPSAPATTH